MTPKDLSNLLDGREYLLETTPEDRKMASDNNLVIVFGYSDDRMELRGAIEDEVSCYGGGSAFIESHGLLENECDCEECPCFQEKKNKAFEIEAKWDTEGYSWVYETSIPHETFDIMEYGEKYCRGIVFSLENLE